jgi:hypothetical protein
MRGKTIDNIGIYEKNSIPICLLDRSIKNNSKTNFNNVTVFTFNRAILLVNIRESYAMSNIMIF